MEISGSGVAGRRVLSSPRECRFPKRNRIYNGGAFGGMAELAVVGRVSAQWPGLESSVGASGLAGVVGVLTRFPSCIPSDIEMKPRPSALPLFLRFLLVVLPLSPIPAPAQVITKVHYCFRGPCSPGFIDHGGVCLPSDVPCYQECLVNGEQVIGPTGDPARVLSDAPCEVEGVFDNPFVVARACEAIAHTLPYRACEDVLANYLAENFPPAQPKNDGNNKALIAGGIAIAAIAAWKFLAPELPDGAAFQPHANVGFRNGTAFTTAGLSAEWRNWHLSAGSSHDGRGWSRPSGRLDWRVEWAF